MFGDYEIIETVGQGGMGVVYRAKDSNLGRTVALKVLKDDLRAHKALVARFQREAEAYATLNHPNIVHIYSVGAVGKIPYIAMEFIEGGTLSVTMKRERRIPWERALCIAEQIAEALGSAHEVGIIHRDIKPGNIMLSEDEHAYVTDFGIAKVLTAETKLTMEGSRLGTPQYMSPERCRKETGTASSDLYSLGVMLFQMISCRLPYESNDTSELIRKIVSEPAKRLSDYMPDIPEDVERLVAYLIEKKPKDRPQSAAEWVSLSKRVRAGEALGSAGFESSLESMKESVTHSSFSDTHFTMDEGRFLWHVQSFWLNLHVNVRACLVGFLVVLVLYGVGRGVAKNRVPMQAGVIAHSLGATEVQWNDVKPVATFYDELPGVLVVHLSDKTWRPTPLASFGNGRFLLHVDVMEDGVETGEYGLIEVNENEGDARIILPPMELKNIDLVAHLKSQDRGVFGLTSLDGQSEQLYEYEAVGDFKGTTFAALWGMIDYSSFNQVQGYYRVPRSRQLVCIGEMVESKGEWGIYSLLPGRVVEASLIQLGAKIESIALITGGVLFSREDEAGNMPLYRASLNVTEQEPIVMVENLASSNSFSPHSELEKVLLVQRKGDNSEAMMLDLISGELKSIYKDAIQATWHPNGMDVLVLAPDKNGVDQVWQCSGRGLRSVKQVTTFDDGVKSLGPVSVDSGSMMVCGGTDTHPVLMLVDVSGD